MFYYYGRKKQLCKHYPQPHYDTIIEPFAGAAAYALHKENWSKNVILIEKDAQVAGLWEWLIDTATPADILALPTLKVGEKTSEFLHIIHAVTKMAFHYKTIKTTPLLARNWEISRRTMARNVHKVKHWTIICGDYQDAPDIEATWFIDPPYQGEAGMGYQYGSDQLDYAQVGAWIEARKGQVLACAGEKGDYLAFEPLFKERQRGHKRNQERLYYRTAKTPLQASLFAGEDLDKPAH